MMRAARTALLAAAEGVNLEALLAQAQVALEALQLQGQEAEPLHGVPVLLHRLAVLVVLHCLGATRLLALLLDGGHQRARLHGVLPRGLDEGAGVLRQSLQAREGLC